MYKNIIKTLVKLSPALKRIYYNYRKANYKQYYPDWKKILDENKDLWESALNNLNNKKRILIATSMGGLPTAIMLDSILGVALTLRGLKVDFLICDSSLPACLMCEYGIIRPNQLSRYGPRKYLCNSCFKSGYKILTGTGLEVYKYSDWLNDTDIQLSEIISEEAVTKQFDNIKKFEVDGIAIGEHSLAGTLRYFASAKLKDTYQNRSVLKQYIKSSLITKNVISRMIDRNNYDTICCINGIYSPQGIISSVANIKRVSLVTWNIAYKEKSFIFSHNDTYHHTLMNEPKCDWENTKWDDAKRKEIEDYLYSRRRGGRDWIVFHNKNSKEDKNFVQKRIGIDYTKPTIGMLTNVSWDAQLHYPNNAFPDMINWVIKTIKYFENRPDLQLIVRIHPAEISGDIPSRQPILNEIKSNFQKIPKNVFIIPPDSDLSTYSLMENCNAVIIYGTKTGVELTSLGISVIVAGEAWIRGKGITIDAESEGHYYKVLNRLPLITKMNEQEIDMAKKYAYHFFFRRMIPLDFLELTGSEPQFSIKKIKLIDLKEKKCQGLDTICNGIIYKSKFIFEK